MRTLIRILLFLAAASPLHAQLQGEFSTHTIPSAILDEERRIFVRTPPGYASQTRTYPVLYLTDGDRQLAHTAATVEFLAREGRVPEMIVVGIGNTDRTRDLTPTRATFQRPDGTPLELPTAGGAARFLGFIEKELIPWIEGTYRTEPMRLFAGHSFGGLFTMYTLVERPDLFQGRIAVAPSLRYDDEWIRRNVRELTSRRRDLKSSLVFTLGDEGSDVARSFRDLERDLKQAAPSGLRWAALEYPSDDHGSLVMASHHDGLRRIFSDWPMPRDPYGRIAGGMDGAREHYRKLSERFGYTIPVPEAIVNFLGYQKLQAGDVDGAIAIFRENVRNHPSSANVYDSLAEALERKGEIDEARVNYARAVEHGERISDPNLDAFRQNLARVSGQAGE